MEQEDTSTVTTGDIDNAIASTRVFTAAEGVLGAYRANDDRHPIGTSPSLAEHDNLSMLTVCVLVLHNGHKVVGLNYGALDQGKHSAEDGRRYAEYDARQKVCELLGFVRRGNVWARPTLDEAIAADYGVAPCTCGPGDGCTSCATPTGLVGTEQHRAEQDAENRRVTALAEEVDASWGESFSAKTRTGYLVHVEPISFEDGRFMVFTTIAGEAVQILAAAANPVQGRWRVRDHIAMLPREAEQPSPKIITPTVGRKVWFYPAHGLHGLSRMGDQPFDATVVYVHNDRTVNLLVNDHIGEPVPFLKVQLVQPGDEACGEGHRAEWMPFQVKQAGKA